MRRNNIFGQKMVSCITLNAQWLLRESWSSCLFASAIFKVTPSYWRYLVQLCFRKVSTVSIQKFTQEIHRPIGFQQHRCKALGPVDLTSMPCIWHLSGLCNTSPWKCTIQTGKQNCFTALKKINPKTSIARKKKKTSIPFWWNNIPHVFGHDRLKPVVLPIQKKNPRSWLLQVFGLM